MEINHLFAEEHIRKWANAWNHHDLKKILSFYSDDILFSSPKVKLVFPDRPSAIITDKRELGEYFFTWFEEISKLTFHTGGLFLKRSDSNT
jgi:ketosteroid isomerase-like protein